MGYSVTPTKASDEQTNYAWLMLLFSAWYGVSVTVEASEGKALAGRTDMKVRLSRFTASSEKRSVQLFPFLGMIFPQEESEECELCNYPHTRRPPGSPQSGSDLAERNQRITILLGGPWYPSPG